MRAGEEEVRVVGAGARGIFPIGALQTEVGSPQGIGARGARTSLRTRRLMSFDRVLAAGHLIRPAAARRRQKGRA